MLGLEQVKMLIEILEGVIEAVEKNPDIANSEWAPKLQSALDFLKKLEEGFGFLNVL